MDDRPPREIPAAPDRTSPPTLESVGSNLPEQHVTPVPTTLVVAVVRGKDDLYSTGYLWTVRGRRTDMNDRACSILLKCLAVEFCQLGVDFTGYMAAEYLVSRLQRGKKDPLEVRDEKDRQALLLGHLILTGHRGTWMTPGERIPFSSAVRQAIVDTGWLPDRRTYNSWKQYWAVRSFLEIYTVPMDTYLDERDRSSTPYSSYCKGYGNGGHVSRVKKTPYDSEIDGEKTDRDPPSFNLLEIEQYCQLLLAIEREKAERVQS